MYPPGPAARVLLVGLGKPDEVTRGGIRRAASTAAKRARSLGVPRGGVPLPAEARGSVTADEAGQAIAEGLAQGAWQFNEMKRPPEEKKPVLERVDMLAPAETEAVARRAPDRRGDRRGTDARARDPGAARQRLHADLRGRRPRREIAQRHGFGVTVLDKAAIVQGEDGRAAGGGAGQRRGAALHRAGVQGGRGRAGGAGRARA